MSASGRTTLVTGASAGIGEAFARVLASRGDRLILTARREDRLRTLADELKQKHGTESVVIPLDLSASGSAAQLFAETERRGLAVELLINNAGFGKYGEFMDHPAEVHAQMIQLNVTVLVELCRLYLTGMRGRKQGGIINVASVAGFPPTPYFAVYGATKAFVLSFSQALALEVRAYGVHVCALCPGSTATEFPSVASGASELVTGPARGIVQTAEAVAQSGLAGYDAGKLIVVPGFFNKLEVLAVGLMPRALVRRAAAMVNRSQRH
jgi:short-subunit dehydrogenase